MDPLFLWGFEDIKYTGIIDATQQCLVKSNYSHVSSLTLRIHSKDS